MQNPTDQAETESIPTETTVYSNGTHWKRAAVVITSPEDSSEDNCQARANRDQVNVAAVLATRAAVSADRPDEESATANDVPLTVARRLDQIDPAADDADIATKLQGLAEEHFADDDAVAVGIVSLDKPPRKHFLRFDDCNEFGVQESTPPPRKRHKDDIDNAVDDKNAK
jgi:hypothetical protein